MRERADLIKPTKPVETEKPDTDWSFYQLVERIEEAAQRMGLRDADVSGIPDRVQWVIDHKLEMDDLKDLLSSSRLVATDGNKLLVSIDLSDWIAGTSGEVAVSDDGDGSVTLGLDLGNELDIGDSGGFSGLKFNPSTTELEFWLDGTKVSHIATDGSYNDDIP